jgi:Glycosyl hydrolases family 16
MIRNVPLVRSLCILGYIYFSRQASVSASSLAATYDVVWNDEFNSLHRTTWNVAVDSSDAGIQTYQEANVNVTNSDYGTLTVIRTSNGDFTSGQIDTYQKVHFQYCTLSARIKIPNTVAGLVPTFYTQGVEYTESTWPSNGEINIMKVGQGEAIAAGNGNERVVSGLYYTGNDGTIVSKSGSRDCGNDVSGNFFIYTLEWTPDNVTTFYNDRPIWFLDIRGIEEFHQPHYMIFNLAVGGAFPSHTCADPTAASASGGVIPEACSDPFAATDVTAPTPDYMLIDWVRIYDNGAGCQVNVLNNDGINIVQGDSATGAPIDTETGGSVPSPVGSEWGPALTPSGQISAYSPSAPINLITAPSVGSPAVAPNLSPVGTDSGEGGGSPTGSGSAPGGSAPISTGGGDSLGSPSGSDSAPGGSPPIATDGGDSPGSPTGSDSAPGGPNTTPTTVLFTPAPVPAPTSAPLSPPVLMPPVSPPVTAPVVAVRIPVINLPPLAPPEEPPSGFVVSPPLSKCKTDKSKKTGPDVVAGDNASGKGTGKGDNVFSDNSAGGGKAEGTAGKAEGAARYRYHQRRRTQSKETKRHRKLQPPTPPNATLPTNATSKAAGVGADSLGPEDCSETLADALSVDSGVMRHGLVLWAVIAWMVGLPLFVAS